MIKQLILIFTLILLSACSGEGSEEVEQFISDNTPGTREPSTYVTKITPPVDSTYSENSTLDFQVSFNEAVIVSGSPCLSLMIGSNPRLACYIFGSGMNTLFFRYVVVAGDDDFDGLLLSTQIDLQGGTITRASTSEDSKLGFSNVSPDLSDVLINTSITAPEKITSVNQSNLSEDRTEVSFNWNAPNDNGNAIDHYSIRYRKQGQSEFTFLNSNPTGTSATINGLDIESTYEIQVAAYNSVMGPYSDSLTVSTFFNPASLGALIWYEAKDIYGNGVVENDGVSVDSFKDKSGHSNHADVLGGTSATVETVDGKKVIRMSESGYRTVKSLGEAANTDIEVYIIAKTRAVTNSFAFVNENQGNNDRYGSHFPWGNGHAYVDLTMGNRMSGPWGGNTTDFFAWTFRSSTTQGKALERNGVEILNGGDKTNTAPLKKWTLGSNYAGNTSFWKADMQAIFVFDKVLTNSQRIDFFAYIEAEYGVDMQ